jgi:hypothetical protein
MTYKQILAEAKRKARAGEKLNRAEVRELSIEVDRLQAIAMGETPPVRRDPAAK